MIAPPGPPKIQSLHGLRGVMAGWVVLGHVSLALGWSLPLVDRNSLAVDVFIVLSGFVIAMLMERKPEPYPRYITRRAFRLFPLYLPVLAISAVLLPVQLMAWEGGVLTPMNLHRADLVREAMAQPGLHLAAHVPLLQGLVPKALEANAAYTILGQAWSISLEWQFYLIAPWLVSAMAARRWIVVSAFVLLLVLLSPLFSGAFLGANILLFGVGIATHLALKPAHRRSALLAGAICGLGALIQGGAIMLIPLGIWLAVMASSLCQTGSWRHGLARALGSRVPCHIGDLSYSIYLIHMIPLYLAIHACAAAGLDGPAAQAIIALSTVTLTYLGAAACYHAIEKPGISAGSWLAGRLRP